MAFQLTISEREIERFWQSTDVRGADECWLWTASKTGAGKNTGPYGYTQAGGRRVPATNVALILSGKPRPCPPNHYALHSDACVGPACVNPRHLRWGSAQDNSDDAVRLGRIAAGARARYRLTDEDIRYIRSDETKHLGPVALAKQMGVSYAVISNVRAGRRGQRAA